MYTITIDETRDALLTDFSKATLSDRYLLAGETYQGLFARVSSAYAGNEEHAQRLYDYMSKLWFMPSTPVLANGGTTRGLPISCYLNEVEDSMQGIIDTWAENNWLACKGGGIGTYWGNVRSLGETVGEVGKTSGVIPFLKVQDASTLAVSQGNLRRGSSAVFLDVSHPEIEEFIDVRRPTGGDHNRKSPNIHHGVVITDAFMEAVEKDADWDLVSPKTKQIMSTVKARAVWIKILLARLETGEPYIVYIDNVNNNIPVHHEAHGLYVKTSNLCAEITLPTGRDHLGNNRTAVCCLSSLNLEKWSEWSEDSQLIFDVMWFLDNVLQDFIDNAPDTFMQAKYAAMRERSVGLGVMGFHSLLQQKKVPFESVMALSWNKIIFAHIREQADTASKSLALEKGSCPDAEELAILERFSNKLAIAPTASISIIASNSSPGIEPYAANAFTHKTLSGSFSVRNKNLASLLRQYGKDNEETWSDIARNEGSVAHLDFLTQDEKDVYKTAMEMDATWVIELAAGRTPYICQSQSVNLFLPANISKKDLHQVHFAAWKKGMKSLYYCRSTSLQRAEVVSNTECIACQ